MSQAGIVDFEGSHPQVPTEFVTDNGTAVPIANILEILGTIVAAHNIPLETTGSGNTVTIVAQYASAVGSTSATAAGMASFNSADFTVDANGFVSSTGSTGSESFTVDAFTAPGTNPVVPNGSSTIIVTGGQVAAGTTTNVIQTNSLAANTYTIQIQRSQAVAVSTVGDNGVSHFDSTYFSVDSNGFVSLNGSSVGETITGNTGGPLSPSGGNWNIFTDNTNVKFAGAGNTLTQDFAATSNILLGANGSSITSADGNTALGFNALASIDSGISNCAFGHQNSTTISTGSFNTAIGEGAMFNSGGSSSANSSLGWHTLLGSSCSECVAIGYGALSNSHSGSNNVAVGFNSGQMATSSTSCTLVGYESGQNISNNTNCTYIGSASGINSTSGSNNTAVGTESYASDFSGPAIGSNNTHIGYKSGIYNEQGSNNTSLGYQSLQSSPGSNINNNIGIGYQGGFNYTTTESSNIAIGNLGTAAENNTIRLGTQGSGTGEQNECFIAGIIGVTTSNTQIVTIDSVTGQLGVTASLVAETLTGDTGGPLSPTAGNWDILGTSTAAGSIPIQTSGSGSTLTVQVQTSQAIASTDASKIGLASFNSSDFTVDANGFVSSTGSSPTTYTENSGTAAPSAGNINILGTNSALTGYSPWTTGSGATVTLNMPGTVKWVVNATANLGTHTTIAAAIAAASSGDTIFITPGTYTENLTLKAGVNLTAYDCNAINSSVLIIGNTTFTGSGDVCISGIALQTNSDYCISVTGSNASVLQLFNCFIIATNHTSINFTSSNSNSFIEILFCRGAITSTGIAAYSMTSPGNLNIYYTTWENSGVSTTASTASNGVVSYSNSRIIFPITTSSNAFLTIFSCNFALPPGNNATMITHGGQSTSCFAFNSSIQSGSSSAVSISTAFTLINCIINSTNTNAITGAGSILYSGLSFTGTSSVINTTTQGGGTLQGSKNTAPSAGFLGEQIRSFIAPASGVLLSTPNVAQNITSISVTAGIWDISAVGIIDLNGATLTNAILSISTTSATLGTEGDNYIYMFLGAAGISDCSGSIPSWRLTISSTTTVYMVMQSGFAVANPKAYGRISATRVG